MEATNNGGPAFPVVAENGLGNVAEGMSLRDWFAGMALQGYVTHIGIVHGPAPTDADLSRYAYNLADAMLSERGMQ